MANAETAGRVWFNDIDDEGEYRNKYFVFRDQVYHEDEDAIDGVICFSSAVEAEAEAFADALLAAGETHLGVYFGYLDNPPLRVGGIYLE